MKQIAVCANCRTIAILSALIHQSRDANNCRMQRNQLALSHTSLGKSLSYYNFHYSKRTEEQPIYRSICSDTFVCIKCSPKVDEKIMKWIRYVDFSYCYYCVHKQFFPVLFQLK